MKGPKTSIWILAGLICLAAVAGIVYVFVSNPDSTAPMTAAGVSMPRYRAGGWEVTVVTDPATPRVGENRLVVELKDASGKPASGVQIDAYAEMPAMGAMSAMRAPAGLEETAPGRYEGTLNLSMRGEWPLTLEIKDPERGDQRLQFDLATDRESLTIAAGGTLVGGAAMAPDDANTITIDNRRRQMIGVQTGKATHRDLVKSIRAVGEVTYDERLLSNVTLKFDGYIGDLKADYVGAEYVEYVLRHKKGLTPAPAPLRLGDPVLDALSFGEPDLSRYDQLVPQPMTRDPGEPRDRVSATSLLILAEETAPCRTPLCHPT